MYKSRCAVRGCTEHPMWEIVWSDRRLYDVCDKHAHLQETLRYDPGPDGTLLPVDGSPHSGHRSRRAQGSLQQ